MSLTLDELHEKLISSADEKGLPICGQFELTSRCNLSCKMCYLCENVNNKNIISRELTADEWLRLADEARQYGMLYLLLTGGEVFVRKDFKYIYEELSKMGFRLGIFTNATLITREIASWLATMPPANLEVTLYGASPDTYYRVCGRADAYDKTVKGIDMLLSEGIPLSIKTTVIRDNAADYGQIREFAKSRNLELKFVHYISPRRNEIGILPDDIRLSPQDIKNYMKCASADFVNDRIKRFGEEIVTETKAAAKIDDAYPFSKCSAGRSNFWVTWEGKMTPCALIDEPSVSPLKDGFGEAWNSLKEMCSNIPQCRECSDCDKKEECLSCPARLKVETGFFDKRADYLCEYAGKSFNCK